jgi:hypothetical protein
MASNTNNIDNIIKDRWRELGFFYDLDERLGVNQWRFYGSKKGFQNFVAIFDEYISNPNKAGLSQEEDYGPYSYLKIMTWDKPVITADYIAGTLDDLKQLKQIISDKLNKTQAGETFTIDKDYGVANTVTAKFFVMADDFDPASMDELIVSGRQKIVNDY